LVKTEFEIKLTTESLSAVPTFLSEFAMEGIKIKNSSSHKKNSSFWNY
jgi:hypothetical protein